jgi:hypothetical protein
LPLAAALVAFAGGLVAIVGTYWDDAWHTDRGRDSFFIAPHLTLYGGVGVAGAVALGWAARRWAASRGRGVVADRSLALALAGLAATVVSAPVDDAWHRLFGRDAVLWSPPHLLGVLATLALVTGLLTGLAPAAGRRAAAVRLVGAALALAALLVPVMEYDSDVPQFAPVWYLPLVGVAVVLAAPIARAALGGRWPLTRIALAYTVLRLVVVGALLLAGRSAPIVPPVLVPALVADIAAQREWAPWRRALAVTVAVHVAYLPWVWLVPHGTQVPLVEVPASLLVGTLAAWLAGVLAAGRRPGRAARATAGLVLLALVVAAPTPAWAHDPGQGRVRGHAAVAIHVDGATAQVQVRVLDLAGGACGDLDPVGLAARRAGHTRRAPLQVRQACTFSGAMGLPDRGRWFVYATLTGPDGPMETWLAVQADGRHSASAVRELYSRPGRPAALYTVKLVSGAVLYLIGVALLLATLATARRQSPLGRAAAAARQAP